MAEVAIPITLEGQVMGVLDVQDNQLGRIDESSANILRSLTNQVAVALRNARLFTEVERALAQAQAAQERYVAQSWQTTGRHVQRGRAQRQGVPEPDEVLTEQLHQAATALTQPSVVAPDGEHRAVVSPIKLQNQIIGSMQFLGSGEGGQFDAQQLALVQAIADQIAQTAENLRLFDETRQRADYEQLVGKITQEIRQAPNLDLLTKVATEAICNILDVSHGGISFDVPSLGSQREQSNGHNP
jgi:GAF domain-containing protein